MKKRVFATILTIVLLVSMLPVGVFAADAPERTGVLSCCQINPVYETVLSEEAKAEILAELDEIAAQGAEETGDTLQGFLNEAEFVSTMRSNLIDRVPSFTIQFYSPTNYSETYISDLLWQVYTHDGVANHGDYIFWNIFGWRWSVSYRESGGYCYFTMTFQFSYNATADQETLVTDAVDSLIGSFGFDSKTPTAYKVKTIYDWICSNVTYDYEHLNTDASYRTMYSAYGAIIDRTCVCQGYALLLYRLLLRVGVDSRIVTSEDHAWNIVKMGSYYYYADSTWDAGDPYESWWYFLTGTNSFDELRYNSSHEREDGTDYGGYDYTYGSAFDKAHPMAYNDYSLSPCEINDHSCQSITVKEPTCTETGTKVFTCTVCRETFTEALPKGSHNPTKTEARAAACTEAGNSAYYSCTACGKYFSDIGCTAEIEQDSWVIPAAGHKWSTAWTSDAATHWHACTVCGEKNDLAYHASSGGATETEAETCTICDFVIAPAHGHVHTSHMTPVSAKNATCTAAGNQAYYVCDCGKWFEDAAALHEITDRTSVVIPAKGHSSVAVPGTPASCTVAGNSGYYACTACGKYFSDVGCTAEIEQDSWIISATGHSWDDGAVTTPATCKNEGVTTYTCTVCEKTKTESIPKTSHDYMRKPSVAATCTTPGYTAEYACRVCQHTTGGDTIPPLGHSFTAYVYNNDAKPGVDGTETAVCDRDGCHETDTRTAAGTALPLTRFTDVNYSEYYGDPVNWAVANGITRGTSDTTFSPNRTCTRAQVVTFLWRAAGEPAPNSSYCPFTDVKKSEYYYNAVLWAVENGITSGTSATKFSPDASCTRAQVATFLWRANGEPKPNSDYCPFTDVKKSEYYYKAVLWAVEKRITAGTSTIKFSPNASCTRAQIVTFLYRAYG